MNKCVNCSDSDFSFVYAAKDRFHDLPGEFKIIRCENCGIFYTIPHLSEAELEKYYPENYICFTPAINEESKLFVRLDRQLAMSKRRRQIEIQGVGKGKILDVGCATGTFLNEMKNHGWDCYGIEPNKKAAQYANESTNIPIVHGTLNDSHFSDSTFDVVTLWDVLEHISDPNKTLSECYRILKPGGFIFLSLPNSNSLERHMFKQSWLGWDVPRHYRTFNSRNIQDYLRKQRFQNTKVKSFFGHHGVFMKSFTFWLEEIKLEKNLKMVILQIANSLPIRIISLPFFFLLEKMNFSTIMGVSAQKPEINP